jgi:hypothetical protein
LANEGEDIEVIEMPLAETLAGIGSGLIQDGKAELLGRPLLPHWCRTGAALVPHWCRTGAQCHLD